MSFCSNGSTTGFINLTGPVAQTKISAIQANASPFISSFAPRSNPPSMLGNIIDEAPDNTITYNSRRYQLIGGIQICAPTHSGYVLPGQTDEPALELIMPFVNNSLVGTYPVGIFVIVPIYNSSYSDHSAYIKQIMDSTNNPVANIQKIFLDSAKDTTQLSIAYDSCIDLVSDDDKGNINIRVIYFPHGIHLTGQEYQKFTAILTDNNKVPIQDFYVPRVLRKSGMATVTGYSRDDDGQKIAKSKSSKGKPYSSSMPASSPEFINKFKYYLKPVSTTSALSAETCPYYKTNQYKCVPFNKIRDLSGNQVVPGATLDTILSNQADMEDSETSGSMSTDKMLETLGIGAGVVAGIGIVVYAGKFILGYLKQKPV